MSPRGTILFADNDPDFLRTRAEFLEKERYRVIPATNPTEARRLLEQGDIDLAILDIRMANDDDERDTSGLTLAKDPAYQPVPKIMLTGYPTYQAVREAMGPAPDGPPPTVSFLDKREGPEALVEAVANAFDRHVKVNYELDISFADPQSLQGWARQITDKELSKDELNHLAQEIDGLMRKLFYGYTDVVLDTVPAGRPRHILAWARSTSRPSEGPRLIKCSTRDEIRAEAMAMEEWGHLTGWQPQEFEKKESLHFGAILHPPISPELEPVQWLAEYFEWHQAEDVNRILEAFANKAKSLFKDPYPPNQEESLDALYRQQVSLSQVSKESFRQAFRKAIGDVASRYLVIVHQEPDSGTITFELPDGTRVIGHDPIPYLYGDIQFGPPVLLQITLGIMDGYSVLINRHNSILLTDGAAIRPTPALSDFVALESRIRFDWIKPSDLSRLYEFESHLTTLTLTPSEESMGMAHGDPVDLDKASRVIAHLRHLATRVPVADPREYHLGILFHAARILITDTPLARKAHALLAATMTSRSLYEWQT